MDRVTSAAHESLLVAADDGVHIICSCGFDAPLGNFHNSAEAMSVWMKHVLQSSLNGFIDRVKQIQENLPKEDSDGASP
jgi:hypothetical protein